MMRENYVQMTIALGHQPNPCMSLIFPLHILISSSHVCRGVSPTSTMHAEIQMRSGHLFWAKNRQASDAIDLQALFNGYWISTKFEFTVPCQS